VTSGWDETTPTRPLAGRRWFRAVRVFAAITHLCTSRLVSISTWSSTRSQETQSPPVLTYLSRPRSRSSRPPDRFSGKLRHPARAPVRPPREGNFTKPRAPSLRGACAHESTLYRPVGVTQSKCSQTVRTDWPRANLWNMSTASCRSSISCVVKARPERKTAARIRIMARQGVPMPLARRCLNPPRGLP
jgi:hypothetical protein